MEIFWKIAPEQGFLWIGKQRAALLLW